MENSRPHVTLLASPGIGHVIPVLELGKRLISEHNFHITMFVVSTDVTTTKSLLKSPISNLTMVTLPFVDISSLVHPTEHIAAKIAILMRESLPNLHSAISNMKFKPVALIVDLFGTEAFPIANEFNMLKYVFCTTNAWFLAVTIYAPIAKSAMEEHIIQKKPLQLPGCKHVQFEDTCDVYLDMDARAYNEYTRVGAEIPTADGIMITTWEDFDSTSIASLRDPNYIGNIVRVPVYPVGPLYRLVDPVMDKEKHVMEWLDTQPINSVIYVSFGSGGTLSAKQTEELAWGLELSKQRFIWVFHPPMDGDVSGTYFNVGDGPKVLETYLPHGYLTRVQGLGLVVPMWAPQAEILAHPSIGGFLTHCGWNSSMEGIMYEVPMIAWPLFVDQKMNASQLGEDHHVALRLETNPWTDKVIGRKEIAGAVRKVIEGDEGRSMRKQVEQLKNGAEKAISKDGTSHNSLSQIAKDCENRHQGK